MVRETRIEFARNGKANSSAEELTEQYRRIDPCLGPVLPRESASRDEKSVLRGTLSFFVSLDLSHERPQRTDTATTLPMLRISRRCGDRGHDLERNGNSTREVY
jgi:hypothetical protein